MSQGAANASQGQESLWFLATDFMKAEHARSSRGRPFSAWPTTAGLRRLSNSIRSSARAYAVTVLVKVPENQEELYKWKPYLKGKGAFPG